MPREDSPGTDASQRRVDDEIKRGRRDENGLAYKGSQLQIALYVNDHAADLNAAIALDLPLLADARIEWVSPLRERRYAEYQDGAALRAVGLEEDAVDALEDFWPPGGPVWDGLARVASDSDAGVILVEAKSHPGELRGSGTKATDPASVAQIQTSLTATRKWLEVPDEIPPDLWWGPLYQSANRLAHLYFFREVLGVPAWFVHVLFTDDPTFKPTSREAWRPALARAEAELGLSSSTDGYAHVFLCGLEAEPRK
jgi:hypothetical protein